MNLANFLIEIHSTKEFACSGQELVEIVKCIMGEIENPTWYCADLYTNGNNALISEYTGTDMKKIGSSLSSIKIAQSTVQFLSGQFVVVRNGQELIEGDVVKNNYFFRDLGNGLLEIDAFDATKFLVFSNDQRILNKLAKTFNSEILEIKSFRK